MLQKTADISKQDIKSLPIFKIIFKYTVIWQVKDHWSLFHDKTRSNGYMMENCASGLWASEQLGVGNKDTAP